MIQAVSVMTRSIGWALFGVIILLILCNASAEPISGWHPSARDYFNVPGEEDGGDGAAIPIIPMAAKNRTMQDENVTAPSTGIASESMAPPSTGDGTRILVRYNTSEISILADVEI
ncbi:MAG TPA: hypothetical protein PLG55_03045, partial [Methanospirillum sp.]|uniref:hypothetical protein n=1 Tax=Methanospirillum sp. TaxID=45200 RepID=UPI002C5C1C4F